MTFEIPADLLGAAMGMLSMGGFGMPDGVGAQSARMAPRRITTMQGAMVIGQDETLTAYHRLTVTSGRATPRSRPCRTRRPSRRQGRSSRQEDDTSVTLFVQWTRNPRELPVAFDMGLKPVFDRYAQ
jgi:hypothetical protein